MNRHRAISCLICLLALCYLPLAIAEAQIFEVKVDTGKIYYRGELVEIYITVSLNGTLVDADDVQVRIFIPYVQPVDPAPVKLATGVYRATLQLASNAPLGTYGIVVTATKGSYKANGLTSFIVSPTMSAIDQKIESMRVSLGNLDQALKQIDAKVAKLEEGTALLMTSIGQVRLQLEDIGARIIEVKGTVARINTTIGEALVTLNEIRAKVVSIEGNVVTVNTDLGVVKGRIVEIQGGIAKIDSDLGFMMINIPQDIKSLSTPAYSTLIVALAAASGSIITATLLWKILKVEKYPLPPPPP